jgi:hypothetical protein
MNTFQAIAKDNHTNTIHHSIPSLLNAINLNKIHNNRIGKQKIKCIWEGEGIIMNEKWYNGRE